MGFVLFYFVFVMLMLPPPFVYWFSHCTMYVEGYRRFMWFDFKYVVPSYVNACELHWKHSLLLTTTINEFITTY